MRAKALPRWMASGNGGEDVVSEGMVGGEGEEVAGGGAELVDEVRCLLADAAGGLNGEGDEVRLLAVGDLRVLAALGCSGVLGLDEVLLAGGSEVGGGERVSDDYVGEDVSVREDDLQVRERAGRLLVSMLRCRYFLQAE